ncbi:MBL fold metallo-hydrolase, partial [Enterobacter hormaechei subsp. steigerwaltii]|nr:MBL fold metallo-hydrolase [Enterobacter hormaechei subsp. steigerwaltii]
MTLRYEILSVTPFRQNCTLIWDDESGEAVLTDVGGDVPFLLQALANRKLTLTAIWLTHGHLDHAGGVVEMLKTRKVPVLGP